eukprot:Opistho-2@52012
MMRLKIPHLDDLVGPRKQFTTGNGEIVHDICVAFKSAPKRVCVQIPHLDGEVRRSRIEAAVSYAERMHNVSVPLECGLALEAGMVPHLNGCVGGPRIQVIAVHRERPDGAQMTHKCAFALVSVRARHDVPGVRIASAQLAVHVRQLALQKRNLATKVLDNFNHFGKAIFHRRHSLHVLPLVAIHSLRHPHKHASQKGNLLLPLTQYGGNSAEAVATVDQLHVDWSKWALRGMRFHGSRMAEICATSLLVWTGCVGTRHNMRVKILFSDDCAACRSIRASDRRVLAGGLVVVPCTQAHVGGAALIFCVANNKRPVVPLDAAMAAVHKQLGDLLGNNNIGNERSTGRERSAVGGAARRLPQQPQRPLPACGRRARLRGACHSRHHDTAPAERMAALRNHRVAEDVAAKHAAQALRRRRDKDPRCQQGEWHCVDGRHPRLPPQASHAARMLHNLTGTVQPSSHKRLKPLSRSATYL